MYALTASATQLVADDIMHRLGHVAVACEGGLDNRHPRGEHGRLLKKACAEPVGENHRAGVGVLPSGEDAEESALARAVLGDDANLLALVNSERHVGEEHAVAVALRQLFDA